MRILLSSESYWPNHDGGAVFEHRLVQQLIEAGHQVAVVAPGKSWRPYNEQDGQSLIYRTVSGPLPLNKDYRVSYWPHGQVVRALDVFKPDIIHIHTMALTAFSLLNQAKKRSIPVVATNHLMPENVLMSFPSFIMNSGAIRRFFWRTLVNFHNKFLAVSVPTESAAELLREYHLRPPLSVISNGVNVQYYAPAQDATLSLLDRFQLPPHYFLYLGRVNAEKRLDMLVKSFAVAQAKAPDLHLVIAGTGNRAEQLEKLAEELNVGSKVHFIGRVTDDEKRQLYQGAEFFAITSPAELQSIVTLEAAASGLPIVAVDIVALRELCHDQQNGFLVKLDDDQAFADAITRLHTDPALRQRFGQYSRQLVVENHSEEATLTQYLAFYNDALTAATTSVKSHK